MDRWKRIVDVEPGDWIRPDPSGVAKNPHEKVALRAFGGSAASTVK
jgi:hypothetical protein